MQSRVFIFSIYDGNVLVLVTTRGQLASGEAPLVRYEIFHYLTLFFMLMPTPPNFKEVARVEFLIFFENFNAVVLRID